MSGPGRRLALVAATACSFVAASLAFAQPAAQATAARPSAEQAAQLALGQRIYREGVRISGEPLTGIGPAQARLAGKDAACANCHRRSGYGGSEGQFVIRPITGPELLQEQSVVVRSPRIKAQLGSRQRSPYNETLLARAIGAGIDASGKTLDPVMPRYALNERDMKALSAYLFSLSAQPAPGVDEKEIHFATVIQPGVAPEKRSAMLDVMQAFVKDKGANVRSEEQRREAGNMRMYRAYRRWVLHVWELSGPSDSWGAQLDAFYSRQPVFALVGGMGDSSWRPIHEFSERHEIPSVFPQVDLPVVTGTNNYTFYFSRGVVLEAEVLAKFIRDQALADPAESGKIIQVFRRHHAAVVAASAFRAALKAGHANEGLALEDLVLDGLPDHAFWRSLSASKPAALVLWLGSQDLDSASSPALAASLPVYLSFSLLDGKRPEAPVKAGANLRLIYPSDLPPRHDARILRNKLWLHNKGIAITDETVQVNTQFAMTVVSDVVGHIADSFSRDYFVERIEHVVAQTPMPSVFAQVSLGPGQRFASKGSSIVQLLDAEKPSSKALSAWIVP